MNAFESIPTAPTTDCQCNICKGQRALEQLPTLQKQHDELREKHRALESVFQDAQTERDMHTAAYNELRGLVKNMLDEEAKDNPLHPVQNNDGFCPFYTPLAKAINWTPPVKERDLEAEIDEAWINAPNILRFKQGRTIAQDSRAFTISYLKQHPDALAALKG